MLKLAATSREVGSAGGLSVARVASAGVDASVTAASAAEINVVMSRVPLMVFVIGTF